MAARDLESTINLENTIITSFNIPCAIQRIVIVALINQKLLSHLVYFFNIFFGFLLPSNYNVMLGYEKNVQYATVLK